MKKMQRLWMRAGQPAILGIIFTALIASLLFFRLGALVRPYTPAEHAARSSSQTLDKVIDNPMYAPHKLGQLALQKVGRQGPLAMRSISVVFALTTVLLFFFVARKWFSTDVALMATVLFASSAYFLHTARAATPHIVLASALAGLVACGIWLRTTSRPHPLAPMFCGVVAIICLYIPGMIWYIVLFIALQRKTLGQVLRHASAAVIVMTFFAGLLLLAPLIVGLFGDSQLLRSIVGLPATLPDPTQFAQNLGRIPTQLFVKGPEDAATWLGRLPILDLFSAVMFILGVYKLIYLRKLDRTKLLCGAILISVFLIALDGTVSLILLMPFIYFIVAHGIMHFMHQWYAVFPRNPFARFCGIVLITTAFIFCVVYNGSRYFIAWPAAQATRQAHSRNP